MTITVCTHGMGEPSWCALCREAATTRSIPSVLPEHDPDVVHIGGAIARRDGGWQPTQVRLQKSGAHAVTKVNLWTVSLDHSHYYFDLEFYRASDLIMEIQLRFREGPERFIGLHRRHRLGVNRHPKGWWSSLRNQSIYTPTHPDRCSKRSPTLEQLSTGAGIPDAVESIEAAGGVTVPRSGLGATKRSNSTLAVLGTTGSQAPHIATFLLSRVLPVYHEYTG